MKVKLNASLVKREGAFFLCGKKNFRLSVPETLEAHEMMEKLSQGICQDQLKRYFEHQECKHLLALLKHHGLVVSQHVHYANTSLEKTYDFLSYHMGSVSCPFEFLPDAHVGIIGCGGTGSNIAICLASSGVRRFSLLDCDTVDVTNLNRQFSYDSRDLGESKTISLKKKLLRLNPSLLITIHEKKVRQPQDLVGLSPDIKLLVSAIDKPAIKASSYVVEYALDHDIPIILGAVGYDSISAGPLLTVQKAKLNYLSSLNEIISAQTSPISGSIASTNLLLSAILANNITAWFYAFTPTDLLNARKIYHPFSLELIGETRYDSD